MYYYAACMNKSIVLQKIHPQKAWDYKNIRVKMSNP